MFVCRAKNAVKLNTSHPRKTYHAGTLTKLCFYVFLDGVGLEWHLVDIYVWILKILCGYMLEIDLFPKARIKRLVFRAKGVWLNQGLAQVLT